MLEVDFHSHTVRSACGMCSALEMIAAARRKGVKGILISDHAPGLGGARGLALENALCGFRSFANRMPDELDGVRVFKGIEANVMDREGAIDVPLDLAVRLDLVLLGAHPYTPYPNGDPETNAAAMARAIERHPWVDIVVHPRKRPYALAVAPLLPVVAERDIALEVNNGAMFHGASTPEDVGEMIRLADNAGVRLSLAGDAHFVDELGRDQHIRRALAASGVEPARIVNRTLADAEAFVAERRERRRRMASE